MYQRPANLFVAKFIGSPPMNTFDAVVRSDGGTPEALVGDATLSLPPDAPVASDGKVVVGVRPEHLRLDPAGPLRGEVRVVELLGHEQHLVCEVGDELVVVRESSDDAPIEVGTTVGIRPDPDHLHLFDAVSGERLG